MWRFALGFIAGAYVHKHYEWPDVDYWIERLKHEEKSRRKK
tara:strand:- start:1214 stop:1336 length:123 start_codon:yes stop_codon:yes gene_type:complete